MTLEDFAAQADAAVLPGMEALLQLAFAAVPRERVEALLSVYLEFVREYMLMAARSRIERAAENDHLDKGVN